MSKAQRHLLVGGVGLVKGRISGLGNSMVSVCDRLEPFIKRSGWFPEAPFATVSLIIRFGAESKEGVDISAINQKHRELPIAVQVSLEDWKQASSDPEELRTRVFESTVNTLEAVADKFE